MTETEIKVLIQPNNWTKVLEYFKETSEKVSKKKQTNYFIDTEGKLLKHRGDFLRYRVEDGVDKAKLTLKENRNITDGISNCIELEEKIDILKSCLDQCSISSRLSDQFVDELSSYSSVIIPELSKRNYGLKQGWYLGSFVTDRTVCNWKNLTVELDESDYLGNFQYEIEIETSEPEVVLLLLKQTLDTLSVSYTLSTQSKFQTLMSLL